MGFWNKLFGGKKRPAEADGTAALELQAPCTVQLAEDPELYCQIRQVTLDTRDGPLPCWLYASAGLLHCGQKELIFLIAQCADPPSEVLGHFLGTVRQYALQGQRVDVGDLTEFGPRGIFGRPHIRGIGYAHPIEFGDILETRTHKQEDMLAAILLRETEVALARRCGLSRTLARLGHAYRQFPYPACSQLDREAIIRPEELGQGVLWQTGAMRLHGASVVRTAGTVELSVPASGREKLREGMRVGQQWVTLATEVGDARAESCLVWQPGSQHPVAITAFGSDRDAASADEPGLHLQGCFVTLLASAPDGEGANIVEDGFSVFLTADSWNRLAEAVSRGSDFALDGHGELANFRLAWLGE